MTRAEIKESFLMALDALRANKVRSALTLLGILVGVFSIILVMTAIRVMQESVESSLSQLGANTFQIQKWPSLRVGGGERDWQKYFRRKNLTYEDAQTLAERLTLAKHIGVDEGLWTAEVISDYEQTNPDVRLRGTTPDTFPGKNWVIEKGRALLDADLDGNRRVCVLGAPVAKKVFPFGSAIGQPIKFHGITYMVVGVLEDMGNSFGSEQGNFVLIPLTTGLNRYGWKRSLDFVIQAPDQATFEEVQLQARGILRTIRKVTPGEEDDFDIVSNDSLITQFRTVTLAVRGGAAAVSSISLVVAGIGIMNIMLVSVTERTREIGVRRAVGAKKKNILLQFIIEAVVLCQVGGVIGVILGILGGNVTSVLMKLPPSIPLDWALYGVLICSAVGVVFGTYPAYTAAHINPIDALRYE
ncbi:MAG: Macrolide export ATP-binding/permease protein MacB [Verrucomicrobia subdivision 3 bacterium]|nr:Macrolide export ATP-binding/permease protein MacB [Limisphaerales bacterium]MCS1414996.1 Macrolide export ATP-binding/permease protein MacB [Limisphaerales bacterium]